METLDFKSRLHFNEFPPISTEEWEATIESDLKGKNYKEILKWNSVEGVAPLPFYRKDQLEKLEHEPAPIFDSASWHILELIDDLDIGQANKHALLALENGASGLRFSLPKSAVTSKSDLEVLLNDINIEFISLHFESELSSLEVAGWLNELINERQLSPESLQICFSFDPFVNAIQSGKLASMKTIKDIIERGDASFRFSAVDAAYYGNAGANIIEQIAFSLGAGNEYLGLDFNLADDIHFNFSAGPNYFLEIAKFRAFKITWKKVLEQYGVEGADKFLTAEIASWNKSKTDAHNNLLRATTEAMSASLGGCDAISVFRFDHHFAEPSGFASRISRNIQIILQEEAYLDKVADPGAGSYYIEKLTDMIAAESWKLFQEIEQKGGFYECLKDGFIQHLISTSREQKIQAYKEKKEVLVGVNKYVPEEVKEVVFKPKEVPDLNIADNKLTDIEKVEPLNIEAELQQGDA
ncbi:MAG: methylmalonyl-CoA mutase family protein [Balneolaceae bacterium]